MRQLERFYFGHIHYVAPDIMLFLALLTFDALIWTKVIMEVSKWY